MRLKAVTIAMILWTLATVIVGPVWVGPPPHRPAKRPVVLAYSERALVFTTLLIVGIAGAGYGSVQMLRRAKDEYRRLSMENMQALIEASIKDKTRNANGPSGTVE